MVASIVIDRLHERAYRDDKQYNGPPTVSLHERRADPEGIKKKEDSDCYDEEAHGGPPFCESVIHRFLPESCLPDFECELFYAHSMDKKGRSARDFFEGLPPCGDSTDYDGAHAKRRYHGYRFQHIRDSSSRENEPF